MRAIDTNVLVRLVIRDDPEQVKAAEGFVEPGAWVSVLALAEAAWVLASAYGLSSREIGDAVDMLLSQKDVSLQDPDVVSAALSDFRKHPKVGLSDCLMVHLARKAGHLPRGTFARELAKLAGAQRL